MTLRLLALITAIFGATSVRAANDDIVVPAMFNSLSYQEQMLACSEYFLAKAGVEMRQTADVEISRFRAMIHYRHSLLSG